MHDKSTVVDGVGLGGLKLEECFEHATAPYRLARLTTGTAIVHMRVGDVSGKASFLARLITSVNSDAYKEIAAEAKATGIERVVLIGGVHRTPDPSNMTDAVKYVKTVAKHFMDAGISSIMISNTPDIDLCLMNDADHLVYVSKSGFSKIAATMTRSDFPGRTVVNAARNYYHI